MIENSSAENFEQLMKNQSDEELVRILKKRDQYQPQAAKAAISEAIKREIINSEQDLLSDKFRAEPKKFRLFPLVENENARQNLIKSISRILLFTGFIPVIWAAFTIQNSNHVEGIMTLIFGVCWITLSSLLFRGANRKYLLLIFVLAMVALVFVLYHLIGTKSTRFIDYFIPVIFIAGITYGTGYLDRLNR